MLTAAAPACLDAAWDRLQEADAVSLYDLMPQPFSGPVAKTLLGWERRGLMVRVSPEPAFRIAPAARGLPCPDDPARAAQGVRWAWTALRRSRAPLTAEQLRHADQRPNSLHYALIRWQRQGLVERLPTHPESYMMTAKARFLFAPPPPARARAKPKPGNATARMWSAIRILKRFDAPQLRLAAEVPIPTAIRFCNELTRAGHLKELKRTAHDDERLWQVARPLGPRPPRSDYCGKTKTRTLFDPNTDKTHDITPRRSAALFFERKD
ncbi:MAG TPA: hypothetical protein VF463_08535 [Sphingobium sp.]